MTDVLTSDSQATAVLADDAPFNGLMVEYEELPAVVDLREAVAGTIGSAAAVINSIVDALSPSGVRDIAMPASLNRVWAAIQSARA